MKFSFENLEVYKRALKMVRDVDSLALSLKGKVSYSFIDQMVRAALSVPLNIAEGNGRWHKNDKKNFFWIARGSVFELVPILDLFRQKELIDEADSAPID